MNTALLTPDSPNLRHLPPEPWGDKLRRARKGSLNIRTQTMAALAIERATGRTMSDATLSRLESREEAPGDRSMRRNAYMLAIVYGFDPADLGLTLDDAPERAVTERLMQIVTDREEFMAWLPDMHDPPCPN